MSRSPFVTEAGEAAITAVVLSQGHIIMTWIVSGWPINTPRVQGPVRDPEFSLDFAGLARGKSGEFVGQIRLATQELGGSRGKQPVLREKEQKTAP